MGHSADFIAVEIARDLHTEAKIAAVRERVQLREWVADAVAQKLARQAAEGTQPTPANKPPRESLRLTYGPDGSVLGPKADKKAATKKPDPNPNADLDALPNPFKD